MYLRETCIPTSVRNHLCDLSQRTRHFICHTGEQRHIPIVELFKKKEVSNLTKYTVVTLVMGGQGRGTMYPWQTEAGRQIVLQSENDPPAMIS